LEADPAGWWTPPFRIAIIRFVSIFLIFLSLLFFLFMSLSIVQSAAQGCRRGIWNANLLDLDLWGTASYSQPNKTDGWRRGIMSLFSTSQRQESDTVLSIYRGLSPLMLFSFTTRG
jgi:hypothetical protein